MAELFADALAPPPPPKLGFTGALSTFFGGDPTGAYTEGLNQGSQYRRTTAQTQQAMEQAEKFRQEGIAQAQVNAAKAKAYADPNFVPDLPFYAMLATGANDLSNARLGDQEHSFRSILGDVGAVPESQFAAGQGVQGRVLPRIETAGGQNYNLATDPNMAAPTMTPLQQADVAAAQALAGQRNRSPASSSAANGGWNMVTVGGRRLRERTNPETGAYESEFVTDPNMLGRERMFAERVRVAAESVADTLENIAQMPVGASTGVFGIGSTPGKGVLASTRDTLRNVAAAESVQAYTAALAGANRALAVLESAGLAPSGTSQQSFEALAWRAGDTEGTRLYKLAEMRQTVDNAMQTALTNPAITPEMRAQIAQITNRVNAAIPFSPMDVIKLQNTPGTVTLADLLQQKGLTAPAPGAAPAAAPASEPVRVQTVEEARALPPGTVFITPDGRRKVR